MRRPSSGAVSSIRLARAVISAFALIARLDPELSGIVALSLRVSLSASLIALVIGAPFGAYLAVSRFRGRQAVIVVTNEVGLGIVPDNRMARLYRDLLGRANVTLAREADQVYLLVSGLPVEIKSLAHRGGDE